MNTMNKFTIYSLNLFEICTVLLVFVYALHVSYPTSFGVLSPARQISFGPWVLFGPAFLFYLSFSNVQEHPLAHKQHDVFSAYVLRHQ
jgi:hypothetical protein